MIHTQVYVLCMKLIERRKTEGLMEKVNVFYLNNQLTEEEYKELSELLKKEESSSEEM